MIPVRIYDPFNLAFDWVGKLTNMDAAKER
jgi:hypothetical protein